MNSGHRKFLYTMNDKVFNNFQTTSKARPGWGTHAIALTCACTCHIKNACVVCCKHKTLYAVHPHLFDLFIFTILFTLFTIALIKCSVHLYSTFYLLFFFHWVTFHLKMHVWYVASLNHCTVCFPICLWFIHFHTPIYTFYHCPH